MKKKYTIGILTAIIALCLTSIAWIMQAYSLFLWESAIEIGLQEYSLDGDLFENAMANREKGIAIADMIWALPLNILAFIGIYRRRMYGFVSAMMVFSICIYFPLFYLFPFGFFSTQTAGTAILLWAFPSLLGIIGLWFNRSQFKL